MRKSLIVVGSLALATAIGWVTIDYLPPEQSYDLTTFEGDANRGAYALRLGGCQACHTVEGGEPYAGGVPLASPFGTFYGPNISPSDEGIGGWSQEDFADAMLNGTGPEGRHYYPTFPFTSYAGLYAQDVADMWAALQVIEPSTEPSRPHDINLVLKTRKPAAIWKFLYSPNNNVIERRALDQLTTVERGAYIVNGPGHCHECHTPRNALGALDYDRSMEGAALPGENEKVPALTPDALRKRGWTHADLVMGFKFGIEPDGDVMGGSMGEVIKGSLSHLTDEDLAAIATYLLDE